MIVPLRLTGGAAGDAWIRRVFPVAVDVMTSAVDLSSMFDESSEGLLDAAALHHAMACCVTAHLGVSSEWGALEVNLNPGFVLCVESTDCVEVPGASQRLGAYTTLRDGVRKWAAWVERASERAWELLGSGQLGFWPAFDRAVGIVGTPTAEQAIAHFDRVAALVGEPRLAPNEREIVVADWREAARPAPVTMARRTGGSSSRTGGSSSRTGAFGLTDLAFGLGGAWLLFSWWKGKS